MASDERAASIRVGMTLKMEAVRSSIYFIWFEHFKVCSLGSFMFYNTSVCFKGATD
jgi:hypothetical protein